MGNRFLNDWAPAEEGGEEDIEEEEGVGVTLKWASEISKNYLHVVTFLYLEVGFP